jgi:hypothetical protein
MACDDRLACSNSALFFTTPTASGKMAAAALISGM